jgi:hypothetical protein
MMSKIGGQLSLFLSCALVIAGAAMVTWAARSGLGWQSVVTGLSVIAIGLLATRMCYRASRLGIAPGPATTGPIILLAICALLWNAVTSGILHL